MEEKLNKIMNNEVKIEDLSPNDLLDLISYLNKKHTNLSNLLELIKHNNSKLDEEKKLLQNELLNIDNNLI